MAEEYEQDDQTRRIALIQDTTDQYRYGINTDEWIQIIWRAQEVDQELKETARERPDIIYEKDGLYYVKNEEDQADRVALSKTVT